MENILLKKSFHAKNFKLLKFNSLWGYKGIFTTIRLFGKEPNFILVDQHLKKLNKDLRYFGIDIKISKIFLTNFLNKYSKIKNYDHLLRIAVTKKIISLSVRKRNKDHKYFTAKFFRFQRALPNFKNLQYKKIISLQKKINLPMINMPQEVYKQTLKKCKKKSSIGLLATEGTLQTGIYNKFFDKNYNLVFPEKSIQKNLLSHHFF